MPELTPEQEQYQKEYNEAAAALEAADKGEQPAPTPAPAKEPEKAPESAPEAKAEVEEPAKPVETLEELRARLEKAEKIAQDNKAWGTKQAQELAALKREREAQRRAAEKPAILDANPDLAEAIRYVANDPAPQIEAEQKHETWRNTIEAAHPGIFDVSIDPELESAISERFKALGDAVHDPMAAIREITAEKVAHAERQIGKRFAIESQKQAQKSAMAVPGPGASAARTAPNKEKEDVDRILNMSDVDFAKEVRRVKGY